MAYACMDEDQIEDENPEGFSLKKMLGVYPNLLGWRTINYN
jgi:hypothetical protein